MRTLVIANKIYSSWSMRPWLLMRHFGIAFDEVMIPLGLPDTRERITRYSPAGKVPILVDTDVAVWDSLAIMEHLAETHPGLAIWPEEPRARALARSVAAEMHAGFVALRTACPMNLGKRFAARDRGEAVARDVERVTEIWRDASDRFGEGGPFLFGAFTAADAMYAPVVTRLDTYGIAVDPVSRAYMDAILTLPAFVAWKEKALRETQVLPRVEVDEEPLANLREAR